MHDLEIVQCFTATGVEIIRNKWSFYMLAEHFP